MKGTEVTAYTDAFGQYRLIDVPAGPISLEVFYTDLDVHVARVEVRPGALTVHDVALTSASRYGSGEVVNLDPFVVSSNKVVEGEALATNEKRFAPNIKEVLATDALGDILGSNVGEFMKFIPGVAAEYAGMDVSGLSIRGFGSNMATFSTDGDEMVTANNDSTRSLDMRGMALNNVSRIEVTKVPTPANPADSLAGSINLVSKNAFERSGALFRYGINLLGNSENLTFDKTPHSKGDVNKRKVLLGAEFDYTLPVGKSFGLVATGIQSNRFHEGHSSQTTYQTGGTATGASIARPYLQTHSLGDTPRSEKREIYTLKADWRLSTHSVLSVSGQWKRYEITLGINTLTSSAGTNGTPTPGSGIPFSFDERSVSGATGRGSVTQSNTGNHAIETTDIASINHRFDNGRWRVESGLSHSNSKRVRVDSQHGSFGALNAQLMTPVRVVFDEIGRDAPGAVRAFDASNNEIDIYDIANYRLTGANAPGFIRRAGLSAGKIDVQRRLGLFPFPSSIQFGGVHRSKTLDRRVTTELWTFNGPDGNPSTIENAAPYRAQVYVGQEAYFGFGKKIEWVSAARAWSAYQENPILFSKTAAQVIDEETRRINGSEYFEEAVSAGYLQGEARLLGSRLRMVGGVRFEKTTDKGEGVLYNPNTVYALNADGTFARDSRGNRVRKLEAGTAGSMEELHMVRLERGYRAKRGYDGYYPSLHLTYTLREPLLLRTAYAKTYGRPDYTDVIPSATINARDLDDEELHDPTVIPGTINVSNTALRPWSADNYDFSVEYYTRHGGMFSGGVFLKQIEDFFGNEVRIATASDLQVLGLDPKYVGWDLRTQFNSGDARVTGAELGFKHSLQPLGEWGRLFAVFANGTRLRLEGNQHASFASFLPKSANWGVSFKWHRVRAMAKWNYRGLRKENAVPSFGAGAYRYSGPTTQLDFDIAVQLSPRISLVSSINNVLNESREVLRYGSETPDYAKQLSTDRYGVIMSLGIKGSF